VFECPDAPRCSPDALWNPWFSPIPPQRLGLAKREYELVLRGGEAARRRGRGVSSERDGAQGRGGRMREGDCRVVSNEDMRLEESLRRSNSKKGRSLRASRTIEGREWRGPVGGSE